MSARRKIAVGLRWLANRVDDTVQLRRADIDARIAASMAIPRAINRYTERRTFFNTSIACGFAPINLDVVRIAAEMEGRQPGLYAGNPDMEAAIERLRVASVSRFDAQDRVNGRCLIAWWRK